MARTLAPTPTPNANSLTPRRALFALGGGNALEWYDWMIWGLLASWLGPHFFPGSNPVSSTLSALAVFAVGFAARPIGAVLLGTVADKVGRRRVMLLSMAAMAVSTLVITVTPGYARIGAWAGVIVVACRIVQGLSTGIEAPLNSTYVVELAPKDRIGRFGGLVGMFVNLGIVAASLVSFLVSTWLGKQQMAAWGWRLPFLVGALAGVVVFWLRRTLPETLHDDGEQQAVGTGRLWAEVGRRPLALLTIVFVVAGAQVLNYAWNVGLPSLSRTVYHEGPTAIFGITTLLGLVMMAMALLGGRMADRWRLSRTFLVLRLLAVPSAFLTLLYTGQGLGRFALVMLLGGVVMALNMALYNIVAATLMPARCRATGVGLGYAVGVALFGGTASYVLLWLQHAGMPWAFPVYGAALCAISALLYHVARKKGQLHVGD